MAEKITTKNHSNTYIGAGGDTTPQNKVKSARQSTPAKTVSINNTELKKGSPEVEQAAWLVA